MSSVYMTCSTEPPRLDTEAYKSVKGVRSSNVWESMSKMCVRLGQRRWIWGNEELDAPKPQLDWSLKTLGIGSAPDP